jgi:hypothetical protein
VARIHSALPGEQCWGYRPGGLTVPDDEPVFSEISCVRRQWTPEQVRDYIAALPIWKEPVEIRQ